MKNVKTILVIGLAVLAFGWNISNAGAQEASQNLISNPSFEGAGTDGQPVNWHNNYWGTNTPTFSFPVEGVSGGKAAQVEILAYSSGDAKWYFDDVPVTAGADYIFSDYYKANTGSEIDIRYTFADGSVAYYWITELPSASDWTAFSVKFKVPANAVSMTVFHLLYSVGNLAIDGTILVKDDGTLPAPDPIPTPNPFSEGMVSLSFDDGWYSQYQNAVPIMDAAGFKGTFYVVTSDIAPDSAPPVSDPAGNLIANPSLEQMLGGLPQFWQFNNWGINSAIFDYPIFGPVGSGNAAQTTITSYSSGDAKWYFQDVPVVAGESYSFSDIYKANVASEIDIRFTKENGTYEYRWVADLPPASEWTAYEKQITIPASTKALSIFHLIASKGTLAVDDFSLTGQAGEPIGNPVQQFVSPSQLLSMHKNGHEIGNHTRMHSHLTQLGLTQAADDISNGRLDLIALGLPAPTSLAYPYGEYNIQVEALVKDSGHSSGRSVDRGFNDMAVDKFALKVQQVDNTTTMNDVRGWVDKAKQEKLWLILVFHEIGPSNDGLGASPEMFRQIVDYLKNSQLKVKTISEGLQIMNQ